MDTSTSSVSISEDDQSDCWSLLEEHNLSVNDGIDFEIVKDLFEHSSDTASISSEVGDCNEENLIPTIITIPNEVESEINNNTPVNEEVDIAVDFHPSNNSLRKRHLSKENLIDYDVETNEPKEKKRKCKGRFYKCPFVTGISLGTLLTVCGLSLMLKSPNKNISNPENNSTALNLNNTLAETLEEHSIWPSLIEEEKLLRKYCPCKNNKGFVSNNKTMRTRLLKRIDRRIKQQMRAYNIKPLTNNTHQEKAEFIGPLNKNECMKEENKNYPACTIKDINDVFVFNANVQPTETETPNVVENSNEKENISNISLNHEKLSNDEDIKQETNVVDSQLAKDINKLENSYEKLKHNIISSRLEESTKSEDTREIIENKINNMIEENLQLSDIIEQEEKIMQALHSKLAHKKRLYRKRQELQKSLEKHLDLLNKRRTEKANTLKSVTKLLSEKSENIPDQLLNEMILVTIKNSNKKTKAVKNVPNNDESKYLLKNNQEYKNYGSTQKENEYQVNIPLMKQKPTEKKLKDALDISLERQKLIAEKARKMEDEEHMTLNNHSKKCSSRKAWKRKRNEYF